jgi:5'-deoxynucleotidase YfbR-like HD superfamily hydrolase
MNVKKLLIGHSIRLKYVTRFSTCRTLHKESVAEHCYFTTLFTLVLAEWLETKGRHQIDFRQLLHAAITHDLEECITGDIPRDFKHSDYKLNETIDCHAGEGFKKVVASILQNPSQERSWYARWLRAKDDNTIEGRILALADFMSVVAYVYEEHRITKSLVLKDHLISLEEYGRSFQTTKFSIFKPIIEQLIEIVKEVLDAD